MLNKIWIWLKARYQLEKGLCPSCNRQVYGTNPSYSTNCHTCHGTTDKLSLWYNFRHKPLPILSPLAESMIKQICKVK